MSLDPDAELMMKVQKGGRLAFEALVVKYQKSVINTIFRSISDPVEAEDLAQNVFVQVWKVRHRYKPTAKFTTWLFTIARNMCLNELRRRGRHPADSMEKPIAGSANSGDLHWQFADHSVKSPSEEALRAELHRRIEAALQTLPEPQRMAMMLIRYYNMPYEDIAKVLRCSLAATKSIIHRARETLRDQIKSYLQP